MALLAAVQVRHSGKLAHVLVFVAIQALGKLDVIKSVPALRNMTLGTLDRGMFLHQRICRSRMLFNAECSGLKCLNVVTRRALPFVGALRKLPVVLVLVAVKAMLEGQRLLEIARGVATQTIHRLVLAFERILGFRMIEALVHCLERHSFPTSGVVARLTTLLGEAAMMRIGMAV